MVMTSQLKSLVTRYRPVVSALAAEYRADGVQPLLDRARKAFQLVVTPSQPALQDPAPPALHQGPARPEVGRSDDKLFAGFAARSLVLIDDVLTGLDELEADERSPERLTQYYAVDNSAARLRRFSDALRILTDHDGSIGRDELVSLEDVVREGISIVQQYQRIEVANIAHVMLTSYAAYDVARMVGELLDNATRYSPPESKVTATTRRTDQGGVVIQIKDAGIGLSDDHIAAIHGRLTDDPRLTEETARHIGFAVVHKLCTKHQITVDLQRPESRQGTVVLVHLPRALLREPRSTRSRPQPTFVPPAVGDATGTPALPDPPQPSASNGVTPSGLPRRRVQEGSTTPSGLPRRQPRGTSGVPITDPEPPRPLTEEKRRARLLADIDGIVAGTQQARGRANRPGDDHDQPPGEGHTS